MEAVRELTAPEKVFLLAFVFLECSFDHRGGSWQEVIDDSRCLYMLSDSFSLTRFNKSSNCSSSFEFLLRNICPCGLFSGVGERGTYSADSDNSYQPFL
jgi:hypothetical protein